MATALHPDRARGQSAATFAAGTLLACALGLRVAHIFAHWDIDWEPDSYEHVLQAKYVISHGAQGLWQLIDVWNKPVYTAVASLVVALVPSGAPTIPALQLVNVGLWLAAVVLTAATAREALESDLAGVWVLALGAFAYLPFRDSVSTLTEPSGALLVASSLYARERGRDLLSLGLIGLAPLARLDAAVLVVLAFGEAVVRRWHRQGRKPAVRVFLTGAALAATPVLLWDALGAVHTGRPLYVLGAYQVASPYGRGNLGHFIGELQHYDPLMTNLALVGALLAVTGGRRLPAVLRLAALQAGVYLAILSVMWARGDFVAELMRYFVLVYPCLLLAATAPLSSAFRQLAPRVGWALVALAASAEIWSLRPLIRPPAMRDSGWEALSTEVGSGAYRAVAALRPKLAGRMVYSDRPEAVYYLGLDQGIYQAPGPKEVNDPSLHGVFIYAGGWSDSLGARASDFVGLRLLAHVPPDLDLYEKP